jgi:hypothetical protein
MKKLFNKRNLVAALLFGLLMTIVSQSASLVAAQTTSDAVVIVMPTIGGTTDPTPGQYNYANGTSIILTAIPDTGYAFSYWVITGEIFPGHTSSNVQPIQITDPETGEVIGTFPPRPNVSAIDSLTFTNNPANVTCGYGYTYTYTAVFAPVSSPTSPSPTPGPTEATVIVMPTVGGSVTPAAGMYTYANGTVIRISATPDAGYKFSYWLVTGNTIPGHTTQISTIVDDNGNVIGQIPRPSTSGIDSLTFTANPASITCGYGYTYTYTAIFEKLASASPSPTATPVATSTPVVTTAPPTASPSPTPTPTTAGGTDWTTWIIIAVVVIVIIIVIAAAMMMRKK